jgi:hypothetical protein
MREARHTVSVAWSYADGAVNPRITRITGTVLVKIRDISGLRNLHFTFSPPLGEPEGAL